MVISFPYLGEIAPVLIRGTIGAAGAFAITSGNLLAAILGYDELLGGETNWWLLFAVNALPLLQLLTCCSFPESPKWLFEQGLYEEARKSLQRLRMTKNVEADMNLMKGGIRKNTFSISAKKREVQQIQQPLLLNGLNGHHGQITNGHHAVANGYNLNGMTKQKCVNFKTQKSKNTKFGIPMEQFVAVKWALIITVVLHGMQQFSGINTVMFYSSSILEDAGL